MLQVFGMANVELPIYNQNIILVFTNPDPLTFLSRGELFFFVPTWKIWYIP